MRIQANSITEQELILQSYYKQSQYRATRPPQNWRTEVNAKWSDEGLESVMRLLAELQINRMKLEYRGQTLDSISEKW